MAGLRIYLLSSLMALPSRARWLSGVCCIVLGVIGCILPVLPGLPFLVVGGRLLGRRDPLLRRLLTLSHHAMRRLRASSQPALRRASARLHPHWRRLARLVLG
jgi:hypothetical protein